MWGAKRRLRRLESQIASVVADQADLYALAATPARAVPGAPMPKALISAARQAGESESSMMLELIGATVAVRVSGEGDPREWWTVIWSIVGPDASGAPEQDVRIERLPIGISAIAVSWASGDLTVSISEAIEPGRQRAAAMAAARAALGEASARQHRPGGATGRGPRARAVAAIGAVVLLTAAVTAVLALAEHHPSHAVKLADPSTKPAPAANVPAGRAGHTARPPVTGDPPHASARTSATPNHKLSPTSSPKGKPTRRPRPSPSPGPHPSSGPLPTPQPSSTTSSAPPTPGPSPTPTPTPSKSKRCVTILGIPMCW